MKRLVLLGVMLAAGCGADLPRWQSDTYDYLYFYRQSKLAGDDVSAALNYRKALFSANASGKLDALAHIVLFKCAVDQAAFEKCPEIGTVPPEYMTEAQRQYKKFLTGETDGMQSDLLPEHYRAFYAQLRTGGDLPEALQAIENPLARLIAASIALQHHPGDFRLLSIADRTASAQGWRTPLRHILGELQKYYAQTGDTQALKKTALRLQMLHAPQ